jgi:formate hydrogenlyase subunit 3/multisubunit Na+/H+ antiporter MnhD subunit
VLSHKSITAGITHMIAHSFAKITLFLAAGIFYTQIKSVKINELRLA